MLRFNKPFTKTIFCLIPYFNTSYVTVQRVTNIGAYLSAYHFNTSYVTVQPSFQNLKMVCFFISIHPMLRFNILLRIPKFFKTQISIHPMLRFNHKHQEQLQKLPNISIHPMLRFNKYGFIISI